MKYLLVLLTISNAFAGEHYLMNDAGVIEGKYLTRDDDPRIVPAEVPKDAPLTDRRGCCRLKWDGSEVVVVSVEERVSPIETRMVAWDEWAALVVKYQATGSELDKYPDLKAEIERKIAEAKAFLDEASRPGKPEDEP